MNLRTLWTCAGLLFLFAGTATAAANKVDVCHNGSTINSDTMEEEAISFIINISTHAVGAHIANHGDCAGEGAFTNLGTGTECELSDDGGMLICEEVTLCECGAVDG